MVRTGVSSIINTTIYPDEDAALAGLEKRTDCLKGYSSVITDTFFYEGDVAFATYEYNKTFWCNHFYKSKKTIEA